MSLSPFLHRVVERENLTPADADEWAALTDTISWEIVTGIGERLPRRYDR